jgi:hypothetical protein
MESNNYEWFITQTVEAMLPRFSHRHLVLAMKIDADWHDYGYGPDGNTLIREASKFRKTFFLVFHRPSNYTKVLMVEVPQNRDHTKNPYIHVPCSGKITMKQLSDHDSCWRSDGMRWVFQTVVDAWEFFDTKEEPFLSGRDIDPSFHYSIFQGAPTYWLLKDYPRPVSEDPNNRWVTDYILDFDRQIQMHEVSKYMPQPEEKK